MPGAGEIKECRTASIPKTFRRGHTIKEEIQSFNNVANDDEYTCTPIQANDSKEYQTSTCSIINADIIDEWRREELQLLPPCVFTSNLNLKLKSPVTFVPSNS